MSAGYWANLWQEWGWAGVALGVVVITILFTLAYRAAVRDDERREREARDKRDTP